MSVHLFIGGTMDGKRLEIGEGDYHEIIIPNLDSIPKLYPEPDDFLQVRNDERYQRRRIQGTRKEIFVLAGMTAEAENSALRALLCITAPPPA